MLKPAHIWGRRLRAHTWSSCYLSGGLTAGETRKFWGEEKRRSGPSGFRAQPWALPSPPHGAHEQTGGLRKCSCCAAAGLSLGLPRCLGSHHASPAVASGAFPHAEGQDKTCISQPAGHCTPDPMVLSPLIPTSHHLTQGPLIQGINGRV